MDDCILVGGLAFYQHESDRLTRDADIMVSCLDTPDLVFSCLAAVPESGTINYYHGGRAATDSVVLEVGLLQKGFNGVAGIDGGAPDAMFTLRATSRGFFHPPENQKKCIHIRKEYTSVPRGGDVGRPTTIGPVAALAHRYGESCVQMPGYHPPRGGQQDGLGGAGG